MRMRERGFAEPGGEAGDYGRRLGNRVAVGRERPDDAGWRAHGDAEIGNVLEDDRIGADDGPAADANSGQTTTFSPSHAPSQISTGSMPLMPWSRTARDVSS